MNKVKVSNYLFHLSYDLKNPSEVKDELYRSHTDIKKDIVWEILINCSNGILYSPVESTIIFESSKDFNFWTNKLHNLVDKIYFVLSQVAIFSKNFKENEMYQFIHPNSNLEGNFKTNIVDIVKSEQARIIKSGRKPKSKFD